MRFAKPIILPLLLMAASAQADPVAPSAQPAKTQADKPQTEKPDVATLLFGNPQWAKAPAGTTIDYAYSKKTAQATFGPSFDDKIVLKLEKGENAQSRTAEVKMFSGMNAKPAGPFRSDPQNPVLLLVLEQNVQELSKIFKANPRYLKNAIRKAWRNEAQITDTQVEIGGKSVPGTKITITPFTGDAEKSKMLGLDAMVYTVEVADNVPGIIANIDIRAPASGKAIFSETLHYQAEKK